MTLLRNFELINQKLFDSGNSTTTPLGIDGVWTGEWIDTSDYISAIISVVTDQPSAVDGMRLETSIDGVNVVHSHTFSPLDNTPDGHHYPSTLDTQFFRVKYTNGAVAQSVFKLYTTLFKIAPEESHVHPINFEIDEDHPSSITRSILLARTPAGNYVNIGCTTGENLKVSVDEIDQSVIDKLTPYVAGAGSNGQVTMVSEEYAYAVPAVAPASNYKISVQNNSDVPIFIGYQNSNSNGIRLEVGDIVSDDLAAGQQLYVYCATPGTVCTYTAKLVG